MPYDPTLPQENTVADAVQMRAQLNGLKDLIDAVSGVTSAVVDAVNTLPAGSPASVMVSVSGSVLHLSFDIPQGQEGAQGAAGQNGSDGTQGPAGNDGAQGPPFTNFVVDAVTTLNPGDNATASASFDGTAVRLNFGIPQGSEGMPGPAGSDGNDGAPGEVTNSDLQTAINGTSSNSNGVATLSFGADPGYNPTQMQDLIAKMNELISALRR